MNLHRTIITGALILLAATLASAAAWAQNTEYPANDRRITYVGRTQATADGVTFDWSGSSVRICFRGTALAIRVSDTDKDYYNLWKIGRAHV